MRSIFLVVPMFAAAPALAQQVDEQFWLQTNAQIRLDDQSRVTLEGIARFSDRLDGLFHTEIGGIISTKVADNVEIGIGYRRVSAHGNSNAADEDRLRQQVVATFGRISTRLRVDQRFHPGGDEIGFRIRPLVRYNQPLGDKGIALFAGHESFYLPNSTLWGQRKGYERMRNQIGVMLPVAEGLNADIAYLNQYRFGKGVARDQMDHALSLQLTIALGGKPQHEDE
ncbi:DUF2490 domain-containing protein [Sphingomonas sp.]|uniref:DUF2490 domain-containing protein n=1 Tax=Sphingomonas sp. TaxID=28214 RepID=UPI0017DDECC0|nr:DUF2490 domain-containing protein [Sphingomonas sp.]MBA4761058.1 DUF2490 domain-containing protein [Sphingomonas sp.]